MQISFLGNVHEKHFYQALKTIKKKIAIPKNLHLYILQHRNYGYLVLKQLPTIARTAFQQALTRRTSFSYHYKNKNILVLYLTLEKKKFMHDPNYIEGLLLHEITHSIHYQTSLYTTIKKSYQQYYTKKLDHLTLSKQKKNILEQIGKQACLLLKDWYVNTELVNKGHATTLLNYYRKDFSYNKTCPQPVFYEKLKPAVQKNPTILIDLFSFEFALFSLLTPLINIQTTKAQTLRKHLENCYNLNMEELERKLQPLLGLYEEHYNKSKNFQEQFFTIIFEKALGLLL